MLVYSTCPDNATGILTGGKTMRQSWSCYVSFLITSVSRGRGGGVGRGGSGLAVRRLCFLSLKQPHNILQRRLMETNLSKLRSSRVPWASKTNKFNQSKSEGLKKCEDDDMILVSCQVMFREQLL